MRRLLTSITAALALVFSTVLVATPAQAATISFDYQLDGTESTWTRPAGTYIPCSAQSLGSYYYRTQALTVDVDGAYAFWDSGASTPGFQDGYIAIYDAFDPASPMSGCRAAFDDNGALAAVTLTAGTT